MLVQAEGMCPLHLWHVHSLGLVGKYGPFWHKEREKDTTPRGHEKNANAHVLSSAFGIF